jgi:hypothetical protein
MRRASKRTSGKIFGSGRKQMVVPLPRAGPLERADGDQLEGGLPVLRVAVDRDAAAVVRDRDRGAVFVRVTVIRAAYPFAAYGSDANSRAFR